MKKNVGKSHLFWLAPLLMGAIVLPVIPAFAVPDSSAKSNLQMAQAPTIEGSWKLANMTAGSSPMPMLPVSPVPTVEFANGKISGSGGCNRFMGSFKTDGSKMSVSPLASTFKACEEGVMQQEMRFLQGLQGAERYEVNDDGLQIYYKTKEGTGVLRFTSQAVRALW